MLTPQVEQMLKTLENLMREGRITPAKEVEAETVLCLTEPNPQGGVVYYQMLFEQLQPAHQTLFKNKKKGDKVGSIKIVAIFDAWA